jgi:hypothetical protein
MMRCEIGIFRNVALLLWKILKSQRFVKTFMKRCVCFGLDVRCLCRRDEKRNTHEAVAIQGGMLGAGSACVNVTYQQQ